VFDVSRDKYKCSIDCRKVDAIVYGEINTLSSEVSLSSPPVFHQTPLCLPTNKNFNSNTVNAIVNEVFDIVNNNTSIVVPTLPIPINTTKLSSKQSQSIIDITSSKLRESIKTNSSWRGSIYIHTQHWFVNSLHQTVIKDDLFNCVELKTDNTVNLLDCISKSSNHLHIEGVLQHSLGYPPNAAVCFEQYVGDDPNTTKSLINYIKGQALNNGIELISQSQNMKKSTGVTYKNVRFSCKYSKTLNQTHESVNFYGNLQLPNTINAREHRGSSRKNASSSSMNTLSNPFSAPSHNMVKLSNGRFDNQLNKTKSSRSKSLSKSCKFAFSVFCHISNNSNDANHKKWYARFNMYDHIHTNHLPINPDDITSHKTTLKSNVTSRIKEMVHASLNTQTIITVIYEEFKVAVSTSTIKTYKDTELDILTNLLLFSPEGRGLVSRSAGLKLVLIYIVHRSSLAQPSRMKW